MLRIGVLAIFAIQYAQLERFAKRWSIARLKTGMELDEEVSKENECEEEQVSLQCDEDFISNIEINQNPSDCFCLANVTH